MELAIALASLQALNQLGPILLPPIVQKVQELMSRGEDPHAFDWPGWLRLYGRSPEALQDEVKAQDTEGF